MVYAAAALAGDDSPGGQITSYVLATIKVFASMISSYL